MIEMSSTTSGRKDSTPIDRIELVEQVRAGCLAVALEAYADAGMRGLCEAGRWERALDAIRSAKFDVVTGKVKS